MPDVDARVISFTFSAERRQIISKSLKTLIFPWKFFDAETSGSPSPLAYDSRMAKIYFDRELSSSEIGCFTSHYAVIEQFVAAGDCDWLVVFEDGVFVDMRFDFPASLYLLEAKKISFIRLYCRFWKFRRSVGVFLQRKLVRFWTTRQIRKGMC
jgi:glycosyl transferase family 25